MDLSFQEKSIAGSLVFTLLLFGYYFSKVFQAFTSDSSEPIMALPFVLIGVVVVLVAIETVYHIAIALRAKSIDEDERDKLIEMKATRISYFVLAAGAFTAIGQATLSVFFGDSVDARLVHNPIMTANIVLFSFILAEITGFALQLYYYRRGF